MATLSKTTEFFRTYVGMFANPKKMVGKPPETEYTEKELEYIDEIGSKVGGRITYFAFSNLVDITSAALKGDKFPDVITEPIVCTKGLEKPDNDSDIDAGMTNNIPLKKRCQLLLDYNNFVSSMINYSGQDMELPKIQHKLIEIPEHDACCVLMRADYSDLPKE